MKTIRIPLMIATILAALALTTAANAGADGLAASPKVRQALNERKASTTPGVAVAPAMACPKCADVLTTQLNPQAKGGQVLAGTGTQKVARHTCTACQTKTAVVGEGKARHTVTTHQCAADLAATPNCCAIN